MPCFNDLDVSLRTHKLLDNTLPISLPKRNQNAKIAYLIRAFIGYGSNDMTQCQDKNV